MLITRRNALIREEVDILCYWIKERERIRRAREAGKKFPWSKDALLTDYRWCNARRMDDKVSRWLLDWHSDYPEVGFRDRVVAAAAGRLINWPDTLADLPYPSRYDEKSWSRILLQRKARGEKIFTGAYIINGALGGDKILQVTQKILTPLWQNRRHTNSHPRTMKSVWDDLNGKPGIGSFMAGQITADLRWIHHELPWEDRMSWAPQGPGSIRGINRLRGQPLSAGMPYGEWLDCVRRAMGAVQARLPKIAERLELMDIQNCLCEYDKYRRLSKGEGSVRSRYSPPRGER
jgi:hypothetical protein